MSTTPEKWYYIMRASHVDYVKPSWTWNTEKIFSRRQNLFFLSAVEENLWQPATQTLNFFKNYMQTMWETANKEKQLERNSGTQAPFWSKNFLTTPVVFHRPVNKIYPRCAIYWHAFQRDQPQTGFFVEGLKTIKNSSRQMRQRYAYVANESTLKLARTTWPEMHRPGRIMKPRD